MDYTKEITKKDLNQLVQEFETGELKHEHWHHNEHVVIAFYYLSKHDEQEATEKIVTGIKNLNKSHGVEQTIDQGYHHTWTIFFIKMILKKMNSTEFQNLSLTQTIQGLISYLENFKDISREYYSKDIIMSWDARKNWVEPDLKLRDF